MKDKKESSNAQVSKKRKIAFIAGVILVGAGIIVTFVLPDTPDTPEIIEEKKDWVFPIDLTDALPENPDCTEDETVSPDGECIPKIDFPLDLYVEPKLIEPEVRELTTEEISYDLPQSVFDMVLFLNQHTDLSKDDVQVLMNYAVQAENDTIEEDTENKARQIYGKIK